MKLLILSLLISFNALAGTPIEVSPNQFEISYAENSRAYLAFRRLDGDHYSPILWVNYYDGFWIEERTQTFDFALNNYEIIREGKELYLVNEEGRQLVATREGAIFKQWELTEGFEFNVDIDWTRQKTTYTIHLEAK